MPADAAELASGMQQLGIENGSAAQQRTSDGQSADAPDDFSDDGGWLQCCVSPNSSSACV